MGFDLRSNIKNKPNAQGTLFRHVGSVIPQLTHRGELIDHGTETGMPPEQEDLYRHDDFKTQRQGLEQLAAKQTPGTRIYRGETRGADLAKELGQRGVGMHWTANPDYIISNRHAHRGQVPVVFEAQVTAEARPLSRSHASFSGRRAPLSSEAEIRYPEGTPVHVGVAHVWTGKPNETGVFAPGSDRHDPRWETRAIHAAVPVRNRGAIDYRDVPRHGAIPPPVSRYPSASSHFRHRQQDLFDSYDMPTEENEGWTWKHQAAAESQGRG